MVPVTTTSNNDPSVDLEKAIQDFNSLVKKPDSPTEENLWYAWHFLQVYSIWGLRLPYTEASLKLKLGISDPGQFSFFGGMKEAYGDIHEACGEFDSTIFPQVIEDGTNILDFASDASQGDGDIFSVLIELIDADDDNGALELIGDLRETTKENEEKAGTVKELLGAYKGKLASAKGKIDIVQESVNKDEKTSQATIDKLKGSADVEDSLANLQKMLAAKKAEYKHSVVVASTTTTYAWVGLPGLIAASTVAGIYGSKAVKLLREVEELEDKIAKKNEELNTALQVNKAQDSAITSLSETEHYTDLAIAHTTTVQNAWQSISANLNYVAEKVADMTKEKDNQQVLKTKAIVKKYAENAGKKWALLIPPLKELTRNPYIVVADGEKTLGDLATEVEKEIAKQAA